MITPLPQLLRTLLSRYAQARISQFECDTAANRRALGDAAYTLCVTTGTRDIKEALYRADDLLAGNCPEVGFSGPTPGRERAAQPLVA
ncbi:DUF5133 domain-containing protein [Streptomyces sp. NPDC058372]|uniref:DUF5133 domain-containing protein n=1 Tax=Streptomyces sp. NPDC058372 TaxID=3346464 RepID=UPI003668C46F